MERYPERTKAPIRCALDDDELLYQVRLALDELAKINDPYSEEMIIASDRLGKFITDEFLDDEQRFVSGLAFKGDSDDIFNDEWELLQLSGYYPGGLVFRQDPRNYRLSAMLQFQDRREPLRLIDGQPLYEAYYFPLEDILVYGAEREAKVASLRILLDAISTESYDLMCDYDQLAPHEQERRINYLANEANNALKGVLTGKNAELISNDFYQVGLNNDGEETLMRVEKKSDTSERLNIYPEGTILGCDFIERVMSDGGKQIPKGNLREKEPCVVLADEHGIIRYFVPIGTFGDALYPEAL